MASHRFLARLRGHDASEALVIQEASSELAALAYVETAGLVVDLPGVVTIDVRDLELGLDVTIDLELAPPARRKAA